MQKKYKCEGPVQGGVGMGVGSTGLEVVGGKGFGDVNQ